MAVTPERRFRRPGLGLVGYLIMGAAVIATFAVVQYTRADNVRKINQINTAQCQSIRNLYTVIRKTLEDADKRLDTIQYYRDHPAEARVQHRQNFTTLEKFRNPPCPEDVTIPTG